MEYDFKMPDGSTERYPQVRDCEEHYTEPGEDAVVYEVEGVERGV